MNNVDNPVIKRAVLPIDDEYGSANVSCVTINGYEYGINIDFISEEKREWFVQVFGDILERVGARARREVREDREKRLRDLCGLKD